MAEVVVVKKPSVGTSTNPPARTTNAMVASTNAAPKKILEDLRASAITIKKPRGTAGRLLDTANGSLTNTSTAQRFGVRVEMKLLNSEGKPIGEAKAYKATLEPGEVWQFSGQVFDRNVTTGIVARITEDD